MSRHLGIRKALLTVTLVLYGFSTHAQIVEKEVSYSYYLISCGNYVQHRARGNPSDAANTADMFYVAGWLSAYNRMQADGGIPEDTTLDDVMLWLEQYCRENPLSTVETGLYKLGEEARPRRADSQAAPAPTPAPTPAPISTPPPRQSAPIHTPVEGLKPLTY